VANDIPSINLGDANAISGGLNVNASKNIHNEDRSIHNITNTTTTVNNITQVAVQKTEMELLQERKTLYMNECKRAYEDNILEQDEKLLPATTKANRDHAAAFPKQALHSGAEILLHEVHRLGDLPLVIAAPRRGYHEFILAIIFPVDDGDDLALKLPEGFPDAQDVGVLLFPVPCRKSWHIAIVDGIGDIPMLIAHRPIHHDTNGFSQIVCIPIHVDPLPCFFSMIAKMAQICNGRIIRAVLSNPSFDCRKRYNLRWGRPFKSLLLRKKRHHLFRWCLWPLPSYFTFIIFCYAHPFTPLAGCDRMCMDFPTD
jgi:hypothetical protein